LREPKGLQIERSELEGFRERLARIGYRADGSAHGRPMPLQEAPGQLGSYWVDVTPKLAGQWLKANFVNRKVSDDVVMAYARDMRNGVWAPTHQGVAFNDRNELIDGQHRLYAIVACGLTIKMMVTVGLPSQINGKEMTTMDCVDRGRTRSVADQLKIQHKMANGTVIAGMCAVLSNICCEMRTRRLSVGQTLEIYREFEAAAHFAITNRSKDYGLRSVGVLAGFAFAMMPDVDKGPPRQNGIEPGKAKFWEGKTAKMLVALMTERGPNEKPLKEGSPVRLLRDFLTSDEAKLITRSMGRGICELVLQAIWLEVKNERVKKLEPGLDGLNYFRNLQPERVRKIAGMFALPEKGAP
jgi:hypothetical protein